MSPEIMAALNKLEAALRTAIRKDTMAEMSEEWAPAKLKALGAAWDAARLARVELEARIQEALVEITHA
jgi:hypothetical protein